MKSLINILLIFSLMTFGAFAYLNNYKLEHVAKVMQPDHSQFIVPLREDMTDQNNSPVPMRKTAEFRPGFRLSSFDVLVLILGTGWSILLHGMENPLGMAVFFTVTHFFLFCNVLRMRRLYELIWAVLFVALAARSIAVNAPLWPGPVMIMLAVTAALTVLQLRQPSYHGIFWQRLNPGLPQWWAERQ